MLKGRIGCELGTETKANEWATQTNEKNIDQVLGQLSVSRKEKQFGLTADKPNRIKGIFFLDQDNAKTKISPSSTGWSGGWVNFGATSSRSQKFYSYYDTDAKYPSIRVEYYDKHETIVAPFDLEITLGLR
jgi:hypothetical protein